MTAATTPLKPREAMAARRTPEQLKALRLLSWRQVLTSLWAPLTLVGLVFIPYLFLIEYLPSSASWAKPVMQYFALAMFLAWVGLILWRAASPRERMLRKLRAEARELNLEAQRISQRFPDKVSAQAAERIAEQALRLEEASLAGDVLRMEKEVKALDALQEEHLGPYRKQSGWDTFSGFAKALTVALLIRTIFIEPYRIPSGSMLPTLEIGDQVFVNKFIYGVRIPFINKVPFQIVRPPARGDVIVFNNPLMPDKDFIKRIVGIPGDRVEILRQVIHINGVPQPRTLVSRDFVVHNQTGSQWADETLVLYHEDLGGVVHAALDDPYRSTDEMDRGPFIVPEGQVFVMGDNRDNSSDSRVGFGVTGEPAYVPYGYIKGKAMVVWVTFGYDGLFSSLFGGTGLRLDRFFEPVR
ncbi:signal peptidase I [Stigmatella sp. ncwal1]|uniref:Signal peptidase I n=1 Tax=Stigmatella ashevillensis TaxID=2995309 RepID=A0ABT5D009_9BACT|nr:signal peptidase I [Stigmatella ashevillena]MDC0707009.1 signal peptidase I [Stigmatella ashevillena]